MTLAHETAPTNEVENAGGTSPTSLGRLVVIYRRHPLVIGAALISALAIASMTLHSRGLVVADARYEHVADPIQFLARHATLWDDQRGVGNPTIYFSPTLSAVQSIFQLIGVTPWLIGRLTLAIYLSIAGCGAMVLSHRLRPGRPALALLAGLLYAFAPYSSQFIFPSSLYLPSTLLPWIMLLVFDGLVRHTRRRSAVLIALLLFTVGLENTAALAFAMLPAALFALFLVAVERAASWRDLLLFAAAVALPALLISAAMLTVLWSSLPVVARVLPMTEHPRTVAASTSAAEAWRGLGQWLTYFRLGGAARPGASPYFTERAVVLATYTTPVLALVGLSFGKLRARRSLGLIAAILLVVVVGAHRPETGPFSWVLDEAFVAHDPAWAFRTTFKAAAGLWLALALLAPSGLEAIVDRLRTWGDRRARRTAARALGTGVLLTAVLAFVASAQPFISGSVFNERDTFRQLPDHWRQYFDDMESLPADARVLALPGVPRARYDWGFVNDSLFNAHLHPQPMMAQTYPTTTPDLTRLVENIDRRLIDDDVEPAAVAPLLRSAGIEWVLVQNEMDIADRSFEFDTLAELRAAPGVTLVATYGQLPEGQPALELFRVTDSGTGFTFWETPPLIVSGGPDASAALARHGWLDRPAVNLAQLDDDALAHLLADGAHIVVTDGSRRRATRASSSRLIESQTLYADEETARPILTVDPDDVTTQSYVVAPGITAIEASRTGPGGAYWSAGNRPGLAFDGDLRTGWYVSQLFGRAVGESVTVRFDEPVMIGESDITVSGGDARITSLDVTATDVQGATLRRAADFGEGEQRTVRLGVAATEITLTITGVSADTNPVGILEVALTDASGEQVDTREFVRVPTEIERLGDDAGAEISYVFGRPTDSREEPTMRREFTVVTPAEYEVRAGVARVGDTATDECIAVGTLNGEPILMRADPRADTRPGRQLVGCERLQLDAGVYRFDEEVEGTGRIVDLAFATAAPEEPIGAEVEWARRSSARYDSALPAGDGYLVTSIPEHADWSYDSGGRFGARLTVDGHTAWIVRDGDARDVSASFAPDVLYRIAVGVTALTVLACLALAWRWRRG